MLNLIPQPAELQLTGKWFRRKNTVRKIKKSELKAEELLGSITVSSTLTRLLLDQFSLLRISADLTN